MELAHFVLKDLVSSLPFDFLNISSHYLVHAGDHMPSYLPSLHAEFSFRQQEESPGAGGGCGGDIGSQILCRPLSLSVPLKEGRNLELGKAKMQGVVQSVSWIRFLEARETSLGEKEYLLRTDASV